MALIQNHAKQRLIDGELSLGMGIRQARTADIGRIARARGSQSLLSNYLAYWTTVEAWHSQVPIANSAG